jgi:ribonuclease HII
MIKTQAPPLALQYSDDNLHEIGIDEAGRGPLFGRLYVAAVILPKDRPFYHKDIKDSKKIKSRKKMAILSEYIKTNALAYSIQYIEHSEIDSINIRQAVFKAAHQCIKSVCNTVNLMDADSSTETHQENRFFIIMDGNDFIPYIEYDKTNNRMTTIPHETIEGGDNKYMAIACASILAKHERDTYMEDLCKTYPQLSEKYHLEKNMGYGTKHHLDGIAQYGITQWHRRTYGRCKDAVYSPIEESGSSSIHK